MKLNGIPTGTDSGDSNGSRQARGHLHAGQLAVAGYAIPEARLCRNTSTVCLMSRPTIYRVLKQYL
jgi:hypothetical protein